MPAAHAPRNRAASLCLAGSQIRNAMQMLCSTQPALEKLAGLQALTGCFNHRTHEEDRHFQQHLTSICFAAQVFILDSLAWYKPRDSKDAESIVERVTPRLQHANCAVVLSAVKVTSSADLDAYGALMGKQDWSCASSALDKGHLLAASALRLALHSSNAAPRELLR